MRKRLPLLPPLAKSFLGKLMPQKHPFPSSVSAEFEQK
jgi:hypothetical protein